MFDITKAPANENKEADISETYVALKDLSFKRNQLIHGIVPSSVLQGNSRSSINNGTSIIRKTYASKTPIHRQKPRHVPSFCSFADSMNISFEKELFEKVSNEAERNIIISHYEPGTIGLRRYAVTHQDEVDGYIFDFSKRSTRLSNDTMDRTVITVGFTGRKKRWTLCPSCDCIPKADKREKIVGQWKILYLPPKGGNLMVPRCVYEAYGDVVDDCNYFAATLCPQQTYCAKHSNQTSFLNRNWHYSYRHQFALQDYVVFCDHLQSVRLVWKLQVPKDRELSDTTAELAEKTLITVMQRFLEYARLNGTSNFFLSAPSLNKYHFKNDNSEESTPLNKSCASDKDERGNIESLQSCSSTESLSSQLDLSKIQLQLASQINSHVPISQFVVQQNSSVPFNPVINSLAPQQSLYLHEFINYLDNSKIFDTSINIDKLKTINVLSSSQNTSSIQMSDSLSNCSSAGTTPISLDCNDTPSMAHARMANATVNSEDHGNSVRNGMLNIDGESQITINSKNNTNCQNLQQNLLESLRNSSFVGGQIQNMCGINQSIALGNFSQVQFPPILHPTGTPSPYLLLGANSTIYPCYIPLNHIGTYDTQSILNNSTLTNKQGTDSNLTLFPLNSQIHSEVAVQFGISPNLNQANSPNICDLSKQNNNINSTLSNEIKIVPQAIHMIPNTTSLPDQEKITQIRSSNPIITNTILKNGDNSNLAQ